MFIVLYLAVYIHQQQFILPTGHIYNLFYHAPKDYLVWARAGLCCSQFNFFQKTQTLLSQSWAFTFFTIFLKLLSSSQLVHFHFHFHFSLSPFSPALKLLSSDPSQPVHFHVHFSLSPFPPFSSNCFLHTHPNLCTFTFIFTFFTSLQIAFFRSIPTCAPAHLYIMYEMHPGNLKLAHLQRRLSI